MSDLFDGKHFIVVDFDFLSAERYVKHSVSGMHFPDDYRPVVFAATDVQLLAVVLLSTLNGAVRYLTIGGRHPLQVGTARVGQHLILEVCVLATVVRHITHAVGANDLSVKGS